MQVDSEEPVVADEDVKIEEKLQKGKW